MFKKKRVLQNPNISIVPALDGIRSGNTVLREEVIPKKDEYFSTNTIILGFDQNWNALNEGKITVEFDVSDLPEKLKSANLKISTTRTHGGLHIYNSTGVILSKQYFGYVLINEKTIDSIDLVKEMQYGKDIGINRLEKYPIIDQIKYAKSTTGKLEVTLKVDAGVVWDVDEISIEDIVFEREEYTECFWMFLGAVLSALFGFIASLISPIILPHLNQVLSFII